jgi:hypothetical protein
VALFLEGEFTLQTTVTHEGRREGHEECVKCGKWKLCMRNCVIEMIRRRLVIKRKITQNLKMMSIVYGLIPGG